jgi:hypothetical protein
LDDEHQVQSENNHADDYTDPDSFDSSMSSRTSLRRCRPFGRPTWPLGGLRGGGIRRWRLITHGGHRPL